MRNDLRDERRWHTALQLEVAALGTRAGFTAALEARATGRNGPSDVVLRRDGELVPVETFVILRDERSREAAEYWDWIIGSDPQPRLEVRRRHQLRSRRAPSTTRPPTSCSG
jgi:hypothetical protein